MSGDGFKFRWQRAFMDSTLPPVARHVLHALGAFMADDGSRCFPSIDTLSNATGLCEKAVRKNLQRAERDGWIRRWERRADNRPLAGKAAQGWRHYQYAPNIPQPTAAPDTAETNVRYDVPHLSTERAVSGSPNVRYDVPLINQVISQEKTNRERGAIAPVAACAAPPPPVFLQDQNQEQNQNPEPERVATESTVPDSDTVTEPTKTEPTATAAEPTPATQRAKPRQRRNEKRGTRLTLEELPDDWRAWSEDFIEHHDIGNLLDIAEMWPLFRDHYRTTRGKSAVQLDWLAVWKNWWRRDLKNLKQRPSTRKMLEENRVAKARREAEQRRWEEQREAEQRKEREAEQRRERDEQRRIELAPTVARVKAYLIDADHGMTAADVANALDMSEQDLEAVYRAGLARDPDIVCCSPLLAPTGEWISKAASDARAATQQAATPTHRTPATDHPWAWCEDAPEPPPAAPEPAPEPPPAPKASAPTPADIEDALRHVEDAGPRGVEISKISWMAPRALSALCKTGRARMNGAIITATRFDAKNKSAETKPLDNWMNRFNTSASTTSTVSITGRAVL